MADLDSLALDAARESGFVLGQKIYSGDYYAFGPSRAVFEGEFAGQPAVLKVYDDPRPSFEPKNVELFNAVNKSKLIRGPKVFASKIITPNRGWYVMEKLAGGGFLKMPLPEAERAEFFKLFLEYRENFPKAAPKEFQTQLAEALAAQDFAAMRIARWLDLANSAEERRALAGEQKLLEPGRFARVFAKGLEAVRTGLVGRKMLWSHGHFKPAELYLLPDQSYVLTDFAHTHYFPEGYEAVFIIWADWLMSANPQLDYEIWKQGVEAWLAVLAPAFSIDFLRPVLIERVLGTVLADLTAAAGDPQPKLQKIELLYRLLADLGIT